jgi:hypothetical protein
MANHTAMNETTAIAQLSETESRNDKGGIVDKNNYRFRAHALELTTAPSNQINQIPDIDLYGTLLLRFSAKVECFKRDTLLGVCGLLNTSQSPLIRTEETVKPSSMSLSAQSPVGLSSIGRVGQHFSFSLIRIYGRFLQGKKL